MADKLIELTAGIIAGYVGGNKVAPADLPGLISSTFAALKTIDAPAPPAPETAPKLTPAQIRKSIRPEALISFIDQRPYRTLKRHLTTQGMTPDEYRAKFSLPKDYPMTASDYSAKRSQMALATGLGQKRAGGRPRKT